MYLNTYDPNNPQVLKLSKHYEKFGVDSRKCNFEYFYIKFSSVDSFKLIDVTSVIPTAMIYRIKYEDVYLVLDNGAEPYLHSADSIYQELVIKLDIPASKIIFMAAIPNMADHVDQLAAKYDQDKIKVEWWSLFESKLHRSTAFRQPLDTLRPKTYQKKFLNFNRRWRLHRVLLMVLLHDRGLIDQGHISFGESDNANDTWEHAWPSLVETYSNDPELLKIIQRNQSVTQLPPMYLDSNNLATGGFGDHQKGTNQYYLDTYFSVVSETTYDNGIPFISEKTIKAITYQHPFILVTVANSLQYLHQLGYKTFNGLIDESYDQELDNTKRLIMIADEIERLCNLTTQELDHFLTESRKICEFNRNHFINKQSFLKRMNF